MGQDPREALQAAQVGQDPQEAREAQAPQGEAISRAGVEEQGPLLHREEVGGIHHREPDLKREINP